MAYTQTILSSVEMAELQELVDEIIRYGKVLSMQKVPDRDGGVIKYPLSLAKRIAEILGLEVRDD